ALKAIEDYQNEFRFHRPHEHRPAGRMARVTPLHGALAAEGARFGTVNGWERATFFPPERFVEEHEFHFTPTREIVAEEVAAVQTAVGIMEVNGFNRVEVEGPGAGDWLASLVAGRIPKRVGKVGLAYALTDRGNVAIEATIAKLSEERFWWGSAAAAEDHDWDWLVERCPEGVSLRRLTESHTILVVAGPNSRALLAAVAPRTDWSAQAFPWLSVREVRIGHWPAIAMSVSYSGELAWELHLPNEALLGAYQRLRAEGERFGLRPFGLYAAESMRLEKGYRHWKADLITEFDPFESGLDRFVKLDHAFPGRAALEGRNLKRRAFVTLEIACDTAPAHPGDSLFQGGEVVGTVTSAAWGHRVAKNLAMGFVDPAQAAEGTEMDIDLLGKRFGARVIAPCQYDPENARVRA
ncbi:MAG: aminomethyltransferase family protein, partial [Pseudomonadota bacterium]